jgi:hypothetical protein
VDHPPMLTDVLKLHFAWHLARIKCLSCLIVALFKVKTVHFTELATAFPGSAQLDSPDRRIQRFFREVQIQPEVIAQLVGSLLPYDQYILSIDRTHWMLGCFSIHFLVLSVVHQGTAFPVFWIFLPKKGTSNTKDLLQLLNQFIDVFGVHKIKYMLSDREFIGEQWFDYLIKQHIKFCIRIKVDRKISRSSGPCAPARNFFRSLPVATSCQ